jgi:hypothetical protein
MQTVPLGGEKAAGRVARVSDGADYDLVALHNWYGAERGLAMYAATNITIAPGRTTVLYMHRLLLPGVAQVDHWDRDGLNNERWNLRGANDGQNHANQAKLRGASQFKGVYWHTRGQKWCAQISFEGRTRHLGLYADEVRAALAYDEAATEAWGPFARLNFPEGTH